MPRVAKPARLNLRTLKGGSKVWVILDLIDGRRKETATGCRAGEREAAERKLAEYIAARHKPNRDSGRDPSAIGIAEVLNLYQLDRGRTVARPYELARRVEALLAFFGDRPISAINKRLCREYAESRGREQAARRELEDLKAALGHACEEEIITASPKIQLPPKAAPRERWLTRLEAAKLIRAAWRFRARNPDGTPGPYTRRHIARFILVGLYTGTRKGAIYGAAIGPAIDRGYINLESGKFYRRAPGKLETNKRQPTIDVPPRLLAHMRRWNRLGVSLRSVIEYEGVPVGRVDQGFVKVVADAGLDTAGPRKVTPHSLRHTSISWTLAGQPKRGRFRPAVPGASVWDVSTFFGVSIEVIKTVYGHALPDRDKAVAAALTG